MKKLVTFWIFIAVVFACAASEYFSLDSERKIILTDRDRWDKGERSLVSCPVSATIIDEHTIIIDFMQECNDCVTIQIIDDDGNVIYNSTYLPNNQILIDVSTLGSGIYQLIYSSPGSNLCGDFSII